MDIAKANADSFGKKTANSTAVRLIPSEMKSSSLHRLCALYAENLKRRKRLKILLKPAGIKRETNPSLRRVTLPCQHFGW